MGDKQEVQHKLALVGHQIGPAVFAVKNGKIHDSAIVKIENHIPSIGLLSVPSLSIL